MATCPWLFEMVPDSSEEPPPVGAGVLGEEGLE
jgi:hypothetical protein